jgi:DNA invertase Pin-like site-specific DNA recombinase
VTRCALYLRVSKDDGSQVPENQRAELLAYAERRGWAVAEVYEDRESGKKGRADREAFDRMFKAAHRRAFDVVLFWSLDRFTREGTAQTFHYLRQLDAAGVAFHSYREEFVNTDSPMVRDVVIAVLSAFAAYEAGRISERTQAGLQRARGQGKRLGRPSEVERLLPASADALRANPALSARALAEEVHTSEATARRILRRLREPTIEEA